MAVTDRINGLYADIAFGATSVTVAAPTVAEIGALTRIECAIVDGPNTPRTGSTIDLTALCDTETRQRAATITNDPITATLYREMGVEGAGTDAYWTLFDDATSGTQYLVIGRGGFTAGTAAAGDIVDVYTVEMMKREAMAPVRGDAQRFNVELAVTQVDHDVTVAA